MSRYRARLTRHRRAGAPHEDDRTDDAVLEIEPGWLRDAGVVAWLIVGIVLVLVGAVWLLALTSTIIVPVITASLIAAVAGPLVDKLHRRRVPRAVGALLVLL